MKRTLLLFLILSIILCTLSSCTQEEQKDKPLIVTTNFALYDFAQNLMGEAAHCQMLLGPGADLHSYEPTPQDLATLEKSDLFLYIGGESEHHILTLLSAVQDIRTLSFLEYDDCSDEHCEDDHEHADDHIWTSPKQALKMLERLCERLTEEFSDNAEYIRENYRIYREKLEALSSDFEEAAVGMPLIVVGDSFPFRHLAHDYSLSYLAATDGCGEDSEPTAARIGQIIDTVKREGISTVFYTETSNGRVASSIAAECGAEVKRLHSCHNLSRSEWDAGESYLSLMQTNLDHLLSLKG